MILVSRRDKDATIQGNSNHAPHRASRLVNKKTFPTLNSFSIAIYRNSLFCRYYRVIRNQPWNNWNTELALSITDLLCIPPRPCWRVCQEERLAHTGLNTWVIYRPKSRSRKNKANDRIATGATRLCGAGDKPCLISGRRPSLFAIFFVEVGSGTEAVSESTITTSTWCCTKKKHR